jgi:hypothetical protein
VKVADDTDTTEETTDEYESYFGDDDDDDGDTDDDAQDFVKEVSKEEQVQALKDEAVKRQRRLSQTVARFNKLNRRGSAVTTEEEIERRGLDEEIRALRELTEWDREAEPFLALGDAEIEQAQAEADDAALAARAEARRLRNAPLSGVDEIERRATMRKQKEAHDAELAALAHTQQIQRVRDRRELMRTQGDNITRALGAARGRDMPVETQDAQSYFADKEKERDAKETAEAQAR